MKKSILGLALLAACVAAFAGSGSAPKAGEQSVGVIVPFDVVPRVLNFEYHRHAISTEGRLMICPASMKAEWGKATCTDTNGANAWQLVETATPAGFKIHSYEFRFPGSGGYRQLIVYYTPR